MRVSRTNRRGLVAFMATLVVLQGAGSAIAQFAPIAKPNQNFTQPQNFTQTPAYLQGLKQAFAQNQNQTHLQNQYYRVAQNQNQTYPQSQIYSQNKIQAPVQSQNQVPLQSQVYAQNQRQVPTPSKQQAYPRIQAYTPTPGQGYTQIPQYSKPQAQPQYTAMAFKAKAGQAVDQSIQPTPAQGDLAPQAAPQAVPAPSYGSYPNGGGMGGVHDYNTFNNDCYGNSGCGDCSTGGRCGPRCFGGVYGLYMGRECNDWVPMAFSTADTQPVGYYPSDNEYVMNHTDLSSDGQGGAEFRVGFFLGGRGCDPCGNSCCGPRYAVEVGYWGLAEDNQSAAVSDTSADGNRLYSMMDMRGLQANMGPGPRPLNHYFDYGPPTWDSTTGGLDEIQVRSLTARSQFSAQNLELNLLRLPALCGGGSCGGCDSCDSGGGGCCAPRYSLSTSVGVRYMRLDDDLYFRSDWENMTNPGTGFAAYNATTENHLVGFQLGSNGVYHIGCSGCWALHCGMNAGIYGNHMEMSQWVDVPVGGSTQYVNGGNFLVDTDTDDVAFIGELRVGASYQFCCNWRFYTGYRAIGISGVALAFDQIPTDFSTANRASQIACSGSIFMHGLQTGFEWTY